MIEAITAALEHKNTDQFVQLLGTTTPSAVLGYNPGSFLLMSAVQQLAMDMAGRDLVEVQYFFPSLLWY